MHHALSMSMVYACGMGAVGVDAAICPWPVADNLLSLLNSCEHNSDRQSSLAFILD